MYAPEHFRVLDRAILLDVIRARPLGLLIAADASGTSADAIPFEAGEAADGAPRLVAHVARANPVWQRLRDNPAALVVFQAQDHYISPSWYATKHETGRVVPTWNYVMVQVRGRACIHEESDWVREQVGALTDRQEAGRPDAWAVADAPAPFVAAQLRAIVGIEIAIDTIEGKFKLSQNRSVADRAGVVAGLRASETGADMAHLMAAHDEDAGRG